MLICSILTDAKLKQYIEISDELGLSALVEAHDEEEINRALKAGETLMRAKNKKEILDELAK